MADIGQTACQTSDEIRAFGLAPYRTFRRLGGRPVGFHLSSPSAESEPFTLQRHFGWNVPIGDQRISARGCWRPMLRAHEKRTVLAGLSRPSETGPSQALINRTSGESAYRLRTPRPGCEQHRGRRITAPRTLLCANIRRARNGAPSEPRARRTKAAGRTHFGLCSTCEQPPGHRLVGNAARARRGGGSAPAIPTTPEHMRYARRSPSPPRARLSSYAGGRIRPPDG